MVREIPMVGGCCVCLDERGWDENPLVYCDGSGCNVAVHQACYGIVKVPSGPWYCCKCRSTERVARVKCELCPKKDGALKRTDNGGWAHVVCALYIPEVRFGNVSTMEPIVYSSVPHERFTKTCYICDENGRDSKLIHGACMACHKAGCKLSFHVTCAQARRLLCEEASINGHVQYVGYCSSHWAKRFKQTSKEQKDNQITEQEIRKNLKEKKRSRTESTSSTNSIEQSSKLNRNRKSGRPPDLNNHIKNSESNIDDISPIQGDVPILNNNNDINKKAALPNSQAKLKEGTQTKIKDNSHFSVNGILSDPKHKISSPLNTPVSKEDSSKVKVKEESLSSSSSDESIEKEEIIPPKKRKLKEKEKIRKKSKSKDDSNNSNTKGIQKTNKKHDKIEKKKKEKSILKEKVKNNEKKKKVLPQPSQLGLVENGKVSSWDSVTPKNVDPPDNFQEFLEHQWSQSAHFILSKAEHFDVASLLTCLHQLKADNSRLEKRLSHLQSRRDRLLGVNARLAASFTNNGETSFNCDSPKNNSLSAMLSKLNDSTEDSPVDRSERAINLPDPSIIESESPDLAMLAAASAKLEGTTRLSLNDTSPTKRIPPDEKPSSSFNDSASLIQPTLNIHNTLPTIDRTPFERDKLFNHT